MFVLARSVKAEDEIQMFRTLCRIADEGFYQVSRMVRPGVREREMADCFRQSVIATGFCVPSSWSMFSTGPSGARLTLPEDGIIESTHVVKYDAGVNAEFDFLYHGYFPGMGYEGCRPGAVPAEGPPV